MKKILLFLLLCFSITLWAANKDKILTTEQESIKVKRMSGKQRCGFTEPLRFAGFSTYFPFGWAEDISGQADDPKLVSKGVFETVFQDMLNKLDILKYMVYNMGYPSFQNSYKNLQNNEIDFF